MKKNKTSPNKSKPCSIAKLSEMTKLHNSYLSYPKFSKDWWAKYSLKWNIKILNKLKASSKDNSKVSKDVLNQDKSRAWGNLLNNFNFSMNFTEKNAPSKIRYKPDSKLSWKNSQIAHLFFSKLSRNASKKRTQN